MKLNVSLKRFINLVHSNAKLLDALFAPYNRQKYQLTLICVIVLFCKNPVNETVSKIKKYAYMYYIVSAM